MPFGLKNGLTTFQRVMDSELLGVQNEISVVYMDDILVYAPTRDKHQKDEKKFSTVSDHQTLRYNQINANFHRKK